MANENVLPNKPNVQPNVHPGSQPSQPNKKGWKLHAGGRVFIKDIGEISDEDLKEEAVIDALQKIELKTGHILFGKVFVQK